MPWWINADQIIEALGQQDPVTESYLTTATIQATMKESAGAEVAGQTWPVTLEYIGGPVTRDGVTYPDGNYRGLLDDSRVLVDGRLYWLELDIDAGADLKDFRRWSDVARYRGKDD